MKLKSLFLALVHSSHGETEKRTDNAAHAFLQFADPAAVELGNLFKIGTELELKTVGTGSKTASRLAPNSAIKLPASLQNSKLVETVCKDSALDAVDNCPDAASQRYPTYDGSCNNRIDTNRGKAFRPLKRLLPSNYADGFQTPRVSVVAEMALPSARTVSNRVESVVNAARVKEATVNHMFTQWGQYIVHDIAHTPVVQAPHGEDLDCNCENPHEECINIPIDMDDIQYVMENKTCFGLPRSSPSPDKDCNFHQREQVNQISATLDANTVYGVSLELLSDIRDPDSDAGELKVSTMFNGAAHGDMLPQSEDMRAFNKKPFQCPMKLNRQKTDCFFAGDKRINENAGLASMHTIFMREHNRVARQLKEVNPQWTSDEIFDETRLIIIAMHQAITYKEYLPALLGDDMMNRYDLNLVPAGYFYGYDASIDASVSNEFTTAAFRFGHSMIKDILSLPDVDWEERLDPIVMKDALFNPEALCEIFNCQKNENVKLRSLLFGVT
jgi:peroxidase